VVIPFLWWADLAMMRSDYRGASGFWDCWPYCTVWQEAAGAVFWFAPLATVPLVIVAVVDLVRVSREAR
jgi:hypothetical protein